MKFLLAIPLLLAACGCTSLTTAHNFHGVEMEGDEIPIETVMIENTGWKLFKFIPIGSGNPDCPGRCSIKFFKDTTTLQNNLDILAKEVERVGATRIANLSSKTIDESVFIILFTRTACRTSAVLLK